MSAFYEQAHHRLNKTATRENIEMFFSWKAMTDLQTQGGYSNSAGAFLDSRSDSGSFFDPETQDQGICAIGRGWGSAAEAVVSALGIVVDMLSRSEIIQITWTVESLLPMTRRMILDAETHTR